MERVKFLLFQKKIKDQLDRDLLFLALFVTGLSMWWVGGDDYLNWKVLESIALGILGLTGMAYSFFGFYSLSEKEKLNGHFIGHIEFGKDKIIAGNQEFNLDNISKIEIFSGDYNGKKNATRFSVLPKVSNGVGNSLRLKTMDSSEFGFDFQLKHENEFQIKMRDILIDYHLKDKISFLALIDHIGISNSYELIQEFKRELEILKLQRRKI